jgi:hypothetical protein
MYWKLFEMFLLDLTLKQGLQPVLMGIGHLSPDTRLLVSQIPTGASKAVGIKYTDAIHFCHIFYRYIMDKRNQLQLSLASREPFLLFSRPNLVSFTTLISEIPTGGSKEVGRENTDAINLHPMFHRCIMDKKTHFYLVLLKYNPFFYCLDQILVHLRAVLDG